MKFPEPRIEPSRASRKGVRRVIWRTTVLETFPRLATPIAADWGAEQRKLASRTQHSRDQKEARRHAYRLPTV